MRLRTGMVLLVAGGLTAIAPEARGEVRGRAQDFDIPVMIQTVPALPGARFSLAGREFTADPNGLALVTVNAPGTYTLAVQTSRPLGSAGQARFVRWSDGSTDFERPVSVHSFTFLEAGFEVSYAVVPRFVSPGGDAIDGGGIAGMTVVGFSGDPIKWTGGAPLSLLSTRVVEGADGLEEKPVGYSVESISLPRQRIPGPAQAPFFPAQDQRVWAIEVSLHDLRIVTVDALLRRPVSSPVALRYPSGRQRTARPDASGEIRLSSLPPGTYQARPSGGVAPARSVSVPGDRDVRLSVVTATDAAIVAALVATLALTGIVVRGLRMRVGRPSATPGVAGRAQSSRRPEYPNREHVRVRLNHGRVIEGWRQPQTGNRPAVWVLDVERVFDADGRQVASIPRDSFLVAAHIVEVERLGVEPDRVIRLDAAESQSVDVRISSEQEPAPVTDARNK